MADLKADLKADSKAYLKVDSIVVSPRSLRLTPPSSPTATLREQDLFKDRKIPMFKTAKNIAYKLAAPGTRISNKIN
jgi:hypothetical protein